MVLAPSAGSAWSARAGRRCSCQADPPGEQFLHHALLDLAGFDEFTLQRGDFGIRVAQDFGDGGVIPVAHVHAVLGVERWRLFFIKWNTTLKTSSSFGAC